MNDRAAAFHWQGLASNVMLWVVALVVLSGLSFTGLQLECDALWHRHADKHGSQCPRHENYIFDCRPIVLMLSIPFLLMFMNQIYAIQVVQLSPRK
jgi:hypothetical protein